MKILFVTLTALLFMACSKENEVTGQSIHVKVGDRTFTATLYNNVAGRAFEAMLPLTIRMSELNGNEKYHYLSDNLPTSASTPSTIRNGDIMLYGSNCLVLFYKTFSSSYRYTSVGYIDRPSGLEEALGRGDVTLSFTVSPPTYVEETATENPPFSLFFAPPYDRIEVEGLCTRLMLQGVDGRVILSSNTASLSVSGVPKGMYILRVDTGKKIYTQKVIKPY